MKYIILRSHRPQFSVMTGKPPTHSPSTVLLNCNHIIINPSSGQCFFGQLSLTRLPPRASYYLPYGRFTLRGIGLPFHHTALAQYHNAAAVSAAETKAETKETKGNKGTVLLETKGRSFCICLPDSQQSEAQTRGRKQKDRPRDLPVTYKRTIPVTFILFHVPPPTQATPHISLNLQLQTGRP